MRRLVDIDIAGKTVLIRLDLNVPISNGQVMSDARLQASIPTLQYCIDQGAQILIMSHLGRPAEGHPEPRFSLKPVAQRLSELIQYPVRLATHWLDGVSPATDEIILCENVRFNVGEKINDPALAKKMAALCDVYVMDAFGTAHRAQASTEGIIHAAPMAVAGPLLCAELDALAKALETPKRPLLAIVGGAKVSTKLGVISNLLDKIDHLIAGGGIANTFLAAAGHNVGKSLCEPELLNEAKQILASGKVLLPSDVRTGIAFSANTPATEKSISEVTDDDMIFDIGNATAAEYANIIQNCQTILWNGPVGVFEFPAFSNGTRALGEAISTSQAFSIAGGGDTLAAIDQFDLAKKINYQSTGGGAFLEFVEGKTLPVVAALKLVSSQ